MKPVVCIEGRNIIVRAPYQYNSLLSAIPGGRWDDAQRAWRYPLSPATALAVVRALRSISATPAFQAFYKEAKEQETSAAAVKGAEVSDAIPLTKTAPWEHQRKAFWFAKELPAALLDICMGGGKTKIVVDLVVNERSSRVLILCPKAVVPVWPKQFALHAALPTQVVALQKGTIEQRTKVARLAVEKGAVVVINHEAAWREPFRSFALKTHWDLVVVDESHRAKAPGGKFSMFLSELGKRADKRLCLTGTPMAHSPLDVYGQYRFLDPGVYGTSFARFRTRYAIMGGYGNHEVKGYQNEQELREKFYSIAFHVGREALDLPPEVHSFQYCDLEGDLARIYASVEDDFYAAVDGGQITAANALVKGLRLQQIAGGTVQRDDGQLVFYPSPKADLLAELLGDLPPDEPVVVFARFKPDLAVIRAVAKAAGRTSGELSGARNDLAEWQAGQTNVLAVQIQAGSVGIDLTRACYCIYYSVGFSLGDYEQSLRRVHRPGQTKPTTFVHLVARDTIDETVYEALAERREVIEYIMKRAA